MKPPLKKMLRIALEDEELKISRRLNDVVAAQTLLDENPVPIWRIHISSGWDGEQSLSKDYEDEMLAHAIKRAATDFCRLNGRIIPGQPSTTKQRDIWKHWDVSGSFRISLCVGSFSMYLNPKSFDHHVKALEKDTDENWYSKPEPKVAKIA